MKQIYLLLVLFFAAAVVAHAQPAKKPAPAAKKSEVPYKLRQYFFVMLSKGEKREQDSATAAQIQEGHMANITKLYNEGKLKVAGPFGDEGNWRGLFIFDCASKEEVEALLKTDPAIAAGSLAYEIHPWWTAEAGSFLRGRPKRKG